MAGSASAFDGQMVARSDLGRRAARNTSPSGPAYAGRMRKFEPGYEDPALLLAEAAGCPDSADERRARLIGQLQRRSDAAAFLAAAEAARAADLELRLVAVEVLGQLGYASERPYREETLPILLGAMDQAVDPRAAGDGAQRTGASRRWKGADPGAAARGAPGRSGAAGCRVHAAVDHGPVGSGARGRRGADSARARTPTRPRAIGATFGLAELLETDTPEVRAALSARLGDVGSIADQARAGLVKRSAPAGEPGEPSAADALHGVELSDRRAEGVFER